MENPLKTPLLQLRGLGKRKRRGLCSLRRTDLQLCPSILGLVGPDRLVRTVLVAGSWAVLTTVLVVALLTGNLSLNLGILWQILPPPEEVRDFSESFELWALIAFFSIQATRVVIPLVPAGPVTLAGVAAFGPWWGFALSLLGAFAGSVSAFLLARRFSRPLVSRLLGEKTLEKYAGKMGADGRLMLIALMTPLPAAGDALCLLAGLSKISLRRFAVMNLVGRIPYTALTVLLASGLTIGSSGLRIGGGIAAALFLVVTFFHMRRRRPRHTHYTALKP
ncbi:MAG: TVP38/TMEM64 family protein [Actinomycetota bacterium]|nr:TVP38/TMEM64 family protein [Actinomycetota bacterium]